MKRKRDMFEDDEDHHESTSSTAQDFESASAPSVDSEVASIPATASSLQSPTDEITHESVELPEFSPITDVAASVPAPVSVAAAVPAPVPDPVPETIPEPAATETIPEPAATDEQMEQTDYYESESDYVNSSDSSVDIGEEEEEIDNRKYFGCKIQASQDDFLSIHQIVSLLFRKFTKSLLPRNKTIFEQVISGTNVQDRDKNGNTFLMLKVTTGDIEGFKQVVPLCKSMNALDLQNKHGDTALITSLYLGLRHGYHDTPLERKNSKKMCRILIDAGADVNKRTIHGYSALEIAAKNDQTDQLHRLLLAGARVDGCFEWNKMTALHCAVEKGNVWSVRELIMFGADISRRCNSLGSTPLMLAQGSEMTKLLLTSGSDVNEANLDGQTPLMIRADRLYDHDWKALSEVQVLLDHNADVIKKDNHGKTALVIAIQKKNYAIARLLIPKSLDTLNIMEGYCTNPLIEHLGRYGSRGEDYFELLEVLLKAGADPNILSCGNSTPLMLSARRYDHKAIMMLGKYGANPNTKNAGQTALHMLLDPCYLDREESFLGFYPTLDALIAIGADIEAKNKDGRTLLNEICYQFMRYGNSDTHPIDARKKDRMQYLLSKGANINTVSNCLNLNLSTPLHYVVRSECKVKALQWLQVLLENDADDSLVDSQGLPAVEYFVRGGNEIELWDRMKATVTSPKLRTALNCILTSAATLPCEEGEAKPLESPLDGFFNRDGALDLLPKIMEMWVGIQV